MPDQSNQERLTSPEISELWTHYIRETLSVCTNKYMLTIVRDPEIQKIYQTALDMSDKHINILTDLFRKENFPIPKGFTEKDVNLQAPPLFTEYYCLVYLNKMAIHGEHSYSLAFSNSIRKDIRDFYYQCNLDTMNLYNQTIELLLAKQWYSIPPFYSTPAKVLYINHYSYVLDVFGERRKMNSIESGHIYFNLEKSILSKAMIFAFRQVCQDQEVAKFLDQGIVIKNKHIAAFTNLLMKENLHFPKTLDTEVIQSTVSPFSDKLILTLSIFLISAAISYYSTAAATSMRADIAGLCEKAVLDDFKLFASLTKNAIKNGWMEQPPYADDRISPS